VHAGSHQKPQPTAADDVPAGTVVALYVRMHERNPGAADGAWRCARRSKPGQRRGRSLQAAAPSCREPLVLLHPFALCSGVWTPVETHLASNYDLIPLAVPGHHGSDPLPASYRHSISAALDLIEAKLDRLGIQRAHIVGNSLGGWLGIELARRGRARSVVALSPGGGWELGSCEHKALVRQFTHGKKLLALGGSLALRLARSRLCRSLLFRYAVAHPERLTAAQAQLLIERVCRCEAYDDLLEAMLTEPVPKPFEAPHCPIKIVWGAKDRILPLDIYSERWRRILPSADWEILPDAGHLPMYDAPLEVAQSILRFVGRRAPSHESSATRALTVQSRSSSLSGCSTS
jgi:pimeloyl-ACP methyl ester carboxylesterase